VRRYAGADHRFSDPPLLDALLDDVKSWMTQALGGSSRTTDVASAAARRSAR